MGKGGGEREVERGRGRAYSPPPRVERPVLVASLDKAPGALAPVEKGPDGGDHDDGEDDFYAEAGFEVERVEDYGFHEAVEDEHYAEGDYEGGFVVAEIVW